MNFRNISSWCIRNPVPPIVLFVGLLLAGIVAFMGMDVNNNPDIDFPAVAPTTGDTCWGQVFGGVSGTAKLPLDSAGGADRRSVATLPMRRSGPGERIVVRGLRGPGYLFPNNCYDDACVS
jgi:hypothetical protein